MDRVKITFAYKTGFRRLWLVLSALWVFLYGYLVVTAARPFDLAAASEIIGPPLILYMVGAAFVWIVEGFAKADR